jgi:hypothetical protein
VPPGRPGQRRPPVPPAQAKPAWIDGLSCKSPVCSWCCRGCCQAPVQDALPDLNPRLHVAAGRSVAVRYRGGVATWCRSGGGGEAKPPDGAGWWGRQGCGAVCVWWGGRLAATRPEQTVSRPRDSDSYQSNPPIRNDDLQLTAFRQPPPAHCSRLVIKLRTLRPL